MKEISISQRQSFIMAIYAFIGLLLLFVSLFSYWNIKSFTEKDQRIKHTYRVKEAATELMLSLLEAETSQRGYIITADSLYLDSYSASLRNVMQSLNSLNLLTLDNPGQREKLVRLQDLIREKEISMNSSIRWKNTKMEEELNRHFSRAKGKELMDVLKAAFENIKRGEEAILTAKNKELDYFLQLTRRGIYVLTFLAVLIILLLIVIFRQHVRIKDAYEHSLHQKNLELATTNEELQASAEEISAGNDQLSELYEELNHSHSRLQQLNENLERTVETRTSELADANKKLRIEVAEKMLAEDSLTKTRDLYRDLYDNSPEMYLSLDADMRVLSCNHTLLNKLGYSTDEVIGQQIFELTHPETLNSAKEAFCRLHTTGIMVNAAVKIKTKKGRTLDILLNSTALRNTSEKITTIRTSMQDITELKKAQDELQEREEYFRLMTENASDLISKHTPEGIYTYVSPVSLPLLGYAQEELLGKSAFEFFHPDDINSVKELLRNPNQDPDQLQFSYRKKHKTGEFIWYETTGKALRDKNGELKELLCVSRDITERKKAEEELQQNITKLELAHKELESFSYSVSHDLRAPLRAIIGFSKILHNDFAEKLGEEGKELAGFIIKNTGKMGMLIDDLLAFSRLGRQEKTEEEFKMDKLVKDVINDLKINHTERKINFITDPLPAAFGDHSLIRHVLMNILSNAIKFTGTRPIAEIIISSFEQNNQVVYSFQDNGVGFNMKYVGKIFDVFQRLHSEAEFPGTGIGMALAQKIVLRHGGKIWAEGEVGKGATFYFTLGIKS